MWPWRKRQKEDRRRSDGADVTLYATMAGDGGAPAASPPVAPTSAPACNVSAPSFDAGGGFCDGGGGGGGGGE